MNARTDAFEREVLIRLAPVWLACRWRVMGGALRAWAVRPMLENDLLGMMDYRREIALACAEKRRSGGGSALSPP
jgi:hypothetical protein